MVSQYVYPNPETGRDGYSVYNEPPLLDPHTGSERSDLSPDYRRLSAGESTGSVGYRTHTER